MTKKRFKKLHAKDALEFFNQVMVDQPLLLFLIPLGLFAWFVERWVVPFSNWVPLATAVWATIQYGRFKRKIAVEDLNKRWKHLILNTMPTTPIEPCEWLNKLVTEVWPNYVEPKLSRKFQSTVETSPLSPSQSGEDWRSAFSSAANGVVDRSSSHNESRSRSADSRGWRYENGDTNGSNSGSQRTTNRLPPTPPGQRY